MAGILKPKKTKTVIIVLSSVGGAGLVGAGGYGLYLWLNGKKFF